MPNKIAPAPHNAVVDPHKRFGDSALGGKERYRTLTSGTPRPSLRQLQLFLQRTGTRAANALAPKGVRTEPRFRAGLQHCSHKVGNVIGLLSQPPGDMDPDTIDRCANACIEACEFLAALPGAAGTSADDLLKARLSVHCQALGLKQLIAFKKGIDQAMPAADGNIKALLSFATEAVDEQLEQYATLAAQQLLKSLAHPDAELRTPEVWRACMRRFDSALAAMPPERRPRMSRVLEPELRKLSLEQLKRLGQQVQEAQPGLSAELQLTPETVTKAVQAKCVQRLSTDLSAWKFSPDTQEYVNQIVTQLNKALQSKDPKEIEFRLQSTQGPGAQLLNFYGVVGPNEDAFKLSMGMLKDICSQLVLDGKLDENELRDLFKALPAATQADLKARQSVLSQGGSKADHLLLEAIEQKFWDLGRDFSQACEAFHAIAADSPDRLMRQAEQLRTARDHWNALNAHRDAHKLTVNLAISKADRRAFSKIKTAAAQLDLSRLDALSDSALHGLAGALSEFKIKQDLPRLQAEIARRKQESNRPYLTALSQALEQLSQADLESALTSLQVAIHHSEQMADVHQALGARAIDVDDRRNITKQVAVDFFRTQPRETLDRWLQALDAEQTQRRAADLRSQASTDRAAAQIGYSVEALRGWVAEAQHRHPLKEARKAMGKLVSTLT